MADSSIESVLLAFKVQAATTPTGSATILLSIVLFLVAGYGLYQWLLPKPIPGIPYNQNSARSLFGDLPSLLKEVLVTKQFFKWCARQNTNLNAPLVQVFVMPFSKPWVFLSDWTEAKDLLARRKELDRSVLAGVSMSPFGLFQACLPTDHQWKKSRQWVQDLMTPSFLKNQGGPSTYAATVNFLRLMQVKSTLAAGRPFDIRRDLNHASRDTLVGVYFGNTREISAIRSQLEGLKEVDGSVSRANKPDQPVEFPQFPLPEYLAAARGIIDLSDLCTITLTRLPYWIGRWLVPQGRSWFASKNRILREQVDRSLERLERGEKIGALDMMVAREKITAEKEGRQPNYKDQGLLDESFGAFCAGEHTTSTANAWIMKFLTENQDVQTKLRSALHAAYPTALAEKRLPTNAELMRAQELVPYLEAVVEEGLRLHSASVIRDVQSDTEILGCRIPKGTTVFFIAIGPGYHSPSAPIDKSKRSATALASPQKGWDETKDLSQYDPERWLVRNEKGETVFDANAGPQLAFGNGPRGCFGKRLAYIALRQMTALQVWSFDYMEVPAELRGREAVTAVLHEANNCYVRLRKRPELGELPVEV